MSKDGDGEPSPVIEVDNPASGDTAARVALLDPEEIALLAGKAEAAARRWSQSTIYERVELCERFLDALESRREEIAQDITAQMGKPISQSRAEIDGMKQRAAYMMSIAPRCLGDVDAGSDASYTRIIERRPVGVVLNIAAWNYPLLIAVNVVVPAVLAGNAVILKHSKRTPLCAMHFERAFREAGAFEGLVNSLAAGHGATAGLIGSDRVSYVAFTGSVEGGRAVSRAAAGRFIDVGLELGGKDPAYVRADADVESTASALAEGAFYNAGQSCCGVERIYVAKPLYADFVEALSQAAAKWEPGNPADPATVLGPMAQAAALLELSAQIDDALAKGARLTVGGNTTTVDKRGRYFESTVIAEATHEMALMTEESFGPVVGVCPVEDDQEALAMMNDSRYGLSASLWTKDLQAASELASHIEAGSVLLNRCDYLDPALPWSGWKDSGVGITLSHLGFDRMTRTRARHFRLA